MVFLFTDETNLQADETAKFFAYGGLLVDATSMKPLHEGVAAIRKKAGYKPGDELKFDTRARPNQVSIETCTAAKRELIQLCIALQCRFIVYVVLHAIAKTTPLDQLVSWGADHVIGKFNFYLQQRNDCGAVIVDRLSSRGEYSYLANKFCSGLEFRDDSPVELDRIYLFASSCIGASHAFSAMDIVLGSFRYCINDPKNVEAAKEMMANVTRLIWHERSGDSILAMERGLIFRPKNVKVLAYQAEYSNLLTHINTLIADMK